MGFVARAAPIGDAARMKLNLGSNDDLVAGYLNVDIAPPADYLADLRQRWPFRDGEVDEIRAWDVFEHLPQIHAMNEAHRVLKRGGKLDLRVPAVALMDGRVNPGAFADPTHVSFWHPDTKYYYCEEWNNPQGERGRLGPAYGITALFSILRWDLIEYGLSYERRSKIVAVLGAVK